MLAFYTGINYFSSKIIRLPRLKIFQEFALLIFIGIFYRKSREKNRYSSSNQTYIFLRFSGYINVISGNRLF